MRPLREKRQYTAGAIFSPAYPRKCPTRPRTIARMEPQRPVRRPGWPPPPKSELREAWQFLQILLYFAPRLLAVAVLFVFGLVFLALLLRAFVQLTCTLFF